MRKYVSQCRYRLWRSLAVRLKPFSDNPTHSREGCLLIVHFADLLGYQIACLFVFLIRRCISFAFFQQKPAQLLLKR